MTTFNLKDKMCLYFYNEEYYIFRNCIDALLGLFILVIIPIISVILALNIDEDVNFFNFYFPIISICLAEIYDAYGRKDGNTKKGTVLNIRIVLAVVSLLSLIFILCLDQCYWLPPSILVLNALLIIFEIFLRVVYNIKSSIWFNCILVILENKFCKEVEDDDDVIQKKK